MSAKRSQEAIDLKRYGATMERYQDRIDRQAVAIDRLVAANAVMGDALSDIETQAKNIREARKQSRDAQNRVNQILSTKEEK